ncbi:MAG: FixH family protein [Gammaproteobacteria bacterium]|nr:FixH family protein [Gammaproteobacteria bacterium]
MNTTEGNRWYRVPFVWLLIGLPLTAVVGSFVSLALAIHSDDGLVEDDYYKRGMEINRQLDRDKAAAARGLESTLDFDDAHHELRVRLNARQAMAWPDNVTLKLMHATRAGLDKTVLLPRQADGSYRMPLPDLAPGHWNVQIAAQDWRLTGSLFVPRGERQLVMRPVSP